MTRFPFVAALVLTGLITAAPATAQTGRTNTAPVAERAEGPARPALTRETVGTADLLSRTAFWAAEFERNGADWEAAFQYAIHLRAMGRLDTALRPSTIAFTLRPRDPVIAMQHGMTLLAAGRPEGAIEPLQIAAAADPRNWRAQTALAAAFDMSGDRAEAARWHATALATAPEQPTVQINRAMSLLLAGDPAGAEAILRDALRLPGAGADVRQNLALVVGVQGRLDEAERLARTDLSPEAAANNVAWMRALLSQPRRPASGG
jgi:Flp pilus assembly protein TadD